MKSHEAFCAWPHSCNSCTVSLSSHKHPSWGNTVCKFAFLISLWRWGQNTIPKVAVKAKFTGHHHYTKFKRSDQDPQTASKEAKFTGCHHYTKFERSDPDPQTVSKEKLTLKFSRADQEALRTCIVFFMWTTPPPPPTPEQMQKSSLHW